MKLNKLVEFVVNHETFDISLLDIIYVMLSECEVSWDIYSLGDGYYKCLLWVSYTEGDNISYYIIDIINTVLGNIT